MSSSQSVTSYEIQWMQHLCGMVDTTRLAKFTLTTHSSFWLRSLSWGTFLTTKHLERLGVPLQEPLASLASQGIVVRSLAEDRWYLQLPSAIDEADPQHATALRNVLLPILPDSVAADGQQLRKYIEDIFWLYLARNDFLLGLQEELMEPYSDLSWHDLAEQPIGPVVVGRISTIDYSELEHTVFFFEGTLSDEMRQRIYAYLSHWFEEIRRSYGQKDLSLRYVLV